MKMNFFTGVGVAVALHAGVLMFGGLPFMGGHVDHGTLQQVALLSEKDIAAEKAKEEKDEAEKKQRDEELEAQAEKAPDAAEMIKNMEAQSNAAPALEAASLSAIEAALNGGASAGGDFAEALSFSSGGRIGGTGKVGSLDKGFDDAFSMAEIDQKPRPIFQAAPVYPPGMKSVQGVVSLLFVVDATGKVTNLRVEKSTHKEFEKPAMEAVRQWKFEPAVKGGKRVSCKMRVPIRFQS
jgi:protein TonB